MSATDWTMARRWTVAMFDPHGNQADFGDYLYEIHSNLANPDNPWGQVDHYDWSDSEVGTVQIADRFVPVYLSGSMVDGRVWRYERERRVRVWDGNQWKEET